MAFLNFLSLHDTLIFCFVFNLDFKNNISMLHKLKTKMKFLVTGIMFQENPVLHSIFYPT